MGIRVFCLSEGLGLGFKVLESWAEVGLGYWD